MQKAGRNSETIVAYVIYGYSVLIAILEKVCFKLEEKRDSWALPGGFGEVGYSPTENILKEIEEETGFTAKAEDC